MILDDAMDSTETRVLFERGELKRLKALRHRARRFVFDEAASAQAGRFATECADLVCEHSQFALPPFPNSYIEIDNLASLRASSRLKTDEGTARRLGFLFHEDGDVYVCSGGDYQAKGFLPFRYHRKGAGGPGTELPDDHEFLRDFLIGEVAVGLRPAVDGFSRHVTDVWSVSSANSSRQLIGWMVEECRGEFKRAIAALLLLNQKRGVEIRDVPPARRMAGGKLRTYMAHSVVSIDIGGDGVRGFFHVESRSSPRRHEVRGHFVHYGIDEACGHEWEPYSTADLERRDVERIGKPVSRWRCSKCQGLRVRREAFHRGDATKGFVTKSYDVRG